MCMRLRHFLEQMIRLGSREPLILVVVLLVAAGVWGFAELTDEVIEGETHAFDKAVLLAMRTSDDLSDPVGPGWVEEMGRDLTALGGVTVLTLITLAVIGFLLLQGNGHIALLVLLATGSGTLLNNILKLGFDRPRPELVSHGSIVYMASFPSGHAMMAAVVYLTLGALLARVQANRALKAYLLSLAVLLTVLVGFSRIYLGVHWPTDVLAGWIIGSAWALLFWVIALWLQQRGNIKQEEYDPEI